mgnify:CR=1 FL=1
MSPAAIRPVSRAVGDHATVNTPGDCLNMRSGAGLSFSSVKCLSNRTAVTIVEGPLVVAGRSWVRVTSPGADGWVASEFLSPVEPVPGTAAGPTKPLLPYRSVAVLVTAN